MKQWYQRLWPFKKKDASLVKVLIIEDNRVDAKMIKKAVDVCGFTALVAYDGKTGVEMAQKHKPNLIILDYHLPDMNGSRVLKELRSDQGTSAETVLVLTILNQPQVIKDSFTYGADRYAIKPINVSLLAEQIQFMLGHPHEKNKGGIK